LGKKEICREKRIRRPYMTPRNPLFEMKEGLEHRGSKIVEPGMRASKPEKI